VSVGEYRVWVQAARAVLEHHGVIVRSAGGWHAGTITPPLGAEQEAQTR
jgi:hypothetical protein